ncbi:MAG: LLM class F420-dependent oxidoreductase [Actinobacteria bacterium]|nr:MAG: LLM class F420-dependent oxidoreductase [Actinomycetota bacterium]
MIRLGLQIPSFTYPGVADDALFERVSDIAVTAEESGFDSIWVMDHFYQLPLLGPPTLNMMESYSLLAALAARTARVQLGTLVTGVTYRNPAVLAKEVTTLDVISRGRAILGIGAAWFDQEHEGYGVPFPSTGERMDRLEEAVQICRAMFTQETATFDGRYYRVKDAINNPRPIRPDGIPIMIGGGGEKRTLRIVAAFADACNLFGQPDEVRHKLDVLARHCEAVGRDPKSINKTRLGTLFIAKSQEAAEAKLGAQLAERGMDLASMDETSRNAIAGMFHVGGPDEIAEQVHGLLDAGLDGLIFNLPDAHDLESVALAGSVLKPLLAA